ncbi:ATP-dependent RecD-like DNA helicase [Ruminococcus sp. CLA-AA-H200]|uniref:ATP-dependent RecD-like DNA helicase n=1 Tax=Ruminococcus turbiniformis TaxID=2881258 RepID=A0ABS8FYB4_9FIRM|nr:AAA family ATPase [Ruminococcus turbiniformis]MCC2254584.1 ATP-dependent RecD-like DNA helicase [Ruminococcus turbiniformis]
MDVIYWKTISQDDITGITEFLAQPMSSCPHVCDGLITCRGKVGIYRKKMPVILDGEWDKHGVFQVTSDRLPSTGVGEGKLLLDYAAPWLTPNQASRISGIGNLLHLDSTAREKLMEMRVKDPDMIIRRLSELSDREKITKILQEYNVPIDRISALLDRHITYSNFILHLYRACLYHDIDIRIADQMAKRYQGIQGYAPSRLCAYIIDALLRSRNIGNTCLTAKSLLDYINRRQDYPITMAMVNMALHQLQDKIKIIEYKGTIYIYERKIYEEESLFISHFRRLQLRHKNYQIQSPKEVEEKLGIKYTRNQRAAFDALKTSGVKILTGPPGSGKTSVIRGFLEAFEPSSVIQLAATTGRASQVLSDATGMQAVTIYRLLDIRPYAESLSSKGPNNPLPGDLIIVDEVSMLGLKLASLLFKAIKSGAILILVGDEDQLQSVEYGNVLSELIRSGQVDVYRLNEVIRNRGTIYENAERINNGYGKVDQDKTFQILDFDSVQEAREKIPKSREEGIQILTTVKKEGLGTNLINKLYQDPKAKLCMKYGAKSFYLGDSIIITKTDYEKGIYNGDVGDVVDGDGDSLTVRIRGQDIRIGKSNIRDVDLAYCITIHKSQGSAYREVYILLPDYSKGMLTRRILYTAITRATEKVYIYSVNHSFEYAVQNGAERKRCTLLSTRLRSNW